MTRHLSTSGLKANPQSKFSLVHCALCVAMAGFLIAFMDNEEDLAMEEESGSCMPTAEMAPVPSSNNAAASTNNAASTLPGNKKTHPSSAGCNTHPVSVPAGKSVDHIRRAMERTQLLTRCVARTRPRGPREAAKALLLDVAHRLTKISSRSTTNSKTSTIASRRLFHRAQVKARRRR